MICLPILGDNPWALESRLSPIKANKPRTQKYNGQQRQQQLWEQFNKFLISCPWVEEFRCLLGWLVVKRSFEIVYQSLSSCISDEGRKEKEI